MVCYESELSQVTHCQNEALLSKMVVIMICAVSLFSDPQMHIVFLQ